MLQQFWIWLDAQPKDVIAPAATLIAAIAAATVALLALRTNAAVNLRNKRVDIISDCNKRYDALAQTKAAIIISIAAIQGMAPNENRKKAAMRRQVRHEIQLYHRRFWGLKSDQIDYWLAGYVDPETLLSWFMSTIDAIHNPVGLWRDFPETLQGGWPSVKGFHRITNECLCRITEAISKEKIASMSQKQRYGLLFALFSLIERKERSLISMLRRNNHRRLSMRRFKSRLPPSVARYVKTVGTADLSILMRLSRHPRTYYQIDADELPLLKRVFMRL